MNIINTMQNKIIILVFIGFLLVSFSILTYTERKDENLETQKLWFLFFADPKNQSLDFNIENHSDMSTFRWEVLADKSKAQEGTLTMRKGETKLVNFSPTFSIKNKIITIKVIGADNTTKEIYKSL